MRALVALADQAEEPVEEPAEGAQAEGVVVRQGLELGSEPRPGSSRSCIVALSSPFSVWRCGGIVMSRPSPADGDAQYVNVPDIRMHL